MNFLLWLSTVSPTYEDHPLTNLIALYLKMDSFRSLSVDPERSEREEWRERSFRVAFCECVKGC